MRLIAFKLWPVILILQLLGFWRRQTRHMWLETGCYRVTLMARRRRHQEAQTTLLVHRITTVLMARHQDALNIFKFHYDPSDSWEFDLYVD